MNKINELIKQVENLAEYEKQDFLLQLEMFVPQVYEHLSRKIKSEVVEENQSELSALTLSLEVAQEQTYFASLLLESIKSLKSKDLNIKNINKLFENSNFEL